MKKNLLLAAALLIPVVIAGCLASGTIVFVFDLEGFGAASGAMQTKQVDLSENEDYQDNKDKIKSVDAITLVGQVRNRGISTAGMEVWLSDNLLANESQVRSQATQIFVSPTIPVGDTLDLNWADGMDYIRNFSVLEDQLKGDGQFYLYGIPTSGIVIEYDLNLIITITAGL